MLGFDKLQLRCYKEHHGSEQQHLLMLGEQFCPVDFQLLVRSCEVFACALYGYASDNINDVPYVMFCSNTVDPSNLHPTRDDLQQHIHRANYQAAFWRRALEAQPVVPSPDSHGWVVNVEGNLAIQWMIQPPAPRDLLTDESTTSVSSLRPHFELANMRKSRQ